MPGDPHGTGVNGQFPCGKRYRNGSCMTKNTSTSFGSDFAVTNEPNTMNRFM